VQREPRVVLDSAHNPAGARRLAAALRDFFLGDDARLHLVLGILADKDQAAMVRALAPIATRVVVTQPPLGERAGDPGPMVKQIGRLLGAANVAFEPSHMRALDFALGDAGPRDIVCVAGSMFLVGAVRERWVPEGRILELRSADLAE
jgi:dihydrofolate synthase/folylpolyglutamate synthase